MERIVLDVIKRWGRSGQWLIDVGLDLGEVVSFLFVLVLDGEVLELLLMLLLVGLVGVVLALLMFRLEVLVALESWGSSLAHFSQLAICRPGLFCFRLALSISWLFAFFVVVEKSSRNYKQYGHDNPNDKSSRRWRAVRTRTYDGLVIGIVLEVDDNWIREVIDTCGADLELAVPGVARSAVAGLAYRCRSWVSDQTAVYSRTVTAVGIPKERSLALALLGRAEGKRRDCIVDG